METEENFMIKRPITPDYREWPYDSPCRSEAPSFREWILETFSLDELIDYAEIRLAAIKRLGPRYQAEMKDEGYEDIEEIN